MNKGFIFGTAFVLALTSGGMAFAKAQQGSTEGAIKGTYNCQLTGGFIAQAGSSALAQFQVDGKGNVTSTVGGLNVSVGGYALPNPNNTDADFLNPSQYNYQIRAYSPAGGTYSLNANGSGSVTMNWTASTNNADSPLDCTGDITTSFNIVVNNLASFVLSSTDLINDCTTGNVNYAACGSSFTGSCQQQSPKF
jgi:hypothetical protein